MKKHIIYIFLLLTSTHVFAKKVECEVLNLMRGGPNSCLLRCAGKVGYGHPEEKCSVTEPISKINVSSNLVLSDDVAGKYPSIKADGTPVENSSGCEWISKSTFSASGSYDPNWTGIDKYCEASSSRIKCVVKNFQYCSGQVICKNPIKHPVDGEISANSLINVVCGNDPYFKDAAGGSACPTNPSACINDFNYTQAQNSEVIEKVKGNRKAIQREENLPSPDLNTSKTKEM